MIKFKYWILVAAAVVRVFTPTIAMAGAAFVFNDSVFSDLCMVLGIISLGWITDIKLPEKPKSDNPFYDVE